MKLRPQSLVREAPQSNLADTQTLSRHSNPPGVASLPAHPWNLVNVVRLWHRAGTQRGIAEVVIETSTGEFLRLGARPLPGFYESGVQRVGKKLKI